MNRIHIRKGKTIVIFLAFCLVGCDFKEFNEGEWLSSSERKEDLYIHVMPNSMDFGPDDGGNKRLSIESNISWYISVKHDWCHVSLLSGTGNQDLTVSCDKNTTNSNRYDTISVISNLGTKEIPVFQSSAPYYILIVDNRPVFNSGGETKTIFVQSNVEWRFKRHPVNSSGITKIGRNDNELSINVGNNPYAIERMDTIVVEGIEYTNLSDTIYITQKAQPPYLKVNDSESSISLNLEKGESSQTISIGSNAEWKVEVNDATWCDIIAPETKTGTRDGHVTVKVAENPVMGDARNATITISTTSGSPTITRTISVHQNKGDDPILRFVDQISILHFDAIGGTLTFSIESNISWRITGAPSWCTVTPTGSSNNQTITISTEKNTASDTRSATLTISPYPASSKVSPISITLQQGTLDIPGGDDNPNPHYSRKR